MRGSEVPEMILRVQKMMTRSKKLQRKGVGERVKFKNC